jgi:hypothetical protein
MFPVSDDNSQRRTLPVVTYALIALNVLIFLSRSTLAISSSKTGRSFPHDFPASPAPTL